MNEPNINEQSQGVAAGCAPATGSAAGEVLSDGTRILFDETTATTRWVLYLHHESKRMNVAIVQNRNAVSVGIENLRHLLDVVVPQHEPPNNQAEPLPPDSEHGRH